MLPSILYDRPPVLYRATNVAYPLLFCIVPLIFVNLHTSSCIPCFSIPSLSFLLLLQLRVYQKLLYYTRIGYTTLEKESSNSIEPLSFSSVSGIMTISAHIFVCSHLSSISSVSYTHLDVYKRQLSTQNKLRLKLIYYNL